MADKSTVLGIEIKGAVFADEPDKSVDVDEFTDAFIELIESKGWYFGGGINQVDEEGNLVDSKKDRV